MHHIPLRTFVRNGGSLNGCRPQMGQNCLSFAKVYFFLLLLSLVRCFSPLISNDLIYFVTLLGRNANI